MFKHLLKSITISRMALIIRIYKSNRFSFFIDNHIRGFMDFDIQFRFLLEMYFSQIAFKPIYLLGAKIKAFIKTLKLIGFIKSFNRL